MTGTAVHFGAGNIGRGFVGAFLYKSGYTIIFVDVMKSIVDQLNDPSLTDYKVLQVDPDLPEPYEITVEHKKFSALSSAPPEDGGELPKVIDAIATADIVTCSVGANILRFIAPAIAQGIAKRSTDLAPLAVIACENLVGNTDQLAKEIKDPKNTPAESLASLEKKAVFANCAVDRIVPNQTVPPPNVEVEVYAEWAVESTPFDRAGVAHPEIKDVKWVPDLTPYIERKLFTVNTAHATTAFYGYNRNKPTIHEALTDASIKAAVDAAVSETAALIVKKHGLSKEEQDKYKDTTLHRFTNAHLNDAVTRVGRQPIRKLGRKERFIGAAAQLADMGMETKGLMAAVEMAFRFQNVEGDQESAQLAEIMATKTPDEVVSQVCGLKDSDALYPKVKAVVEKVQADGRD